MALIKTLPNVVSGTGDELRRKNKSNYQSYYQLAALGEKPEGYQHMYQELFDANPYRNLHYNKSSIQNFLSKLGFRTDADRWDEEMQENAAQYDAGVFQQMYQDQFNSETAKAERMREAGENPDLLGTGNVSEASSPFQDPAGLSPGINQEGLPGQIASGILSAFDTAVGMASQLAQLQGIQNDVTGKGISNADAMMRLINQRVLGLTPAEGFKTDKDFSDWKKSVEASLRTNYGRSFFKGRSLRQWNRTLDDFIGGLPQSRDQYDAWKSRLGNAKDYLMGREDHWSESIQLFKELNHNLIDMNNAITENRKSAEQINSEVDVEKAGYELEYQQGRDAGLRAQAENADNRRHKEGDTFEGILNKHLAKIADTLDKFTKDGGFAGWVAEIVLFIMASKGISVSTTKNGANVSIPMPQSR